MNKPYYVWKIEDGATHWFVSQDANTAIEYIASLHDLTVDQYRQEFEPVVSQVPPNEIVRVELDEFDVARHSKVGLPNQCRFFAEVMPWMFLKDGPERPICSTEF